jgi:hypothetical protein
MLAALLGPWRYLLYAGIVAAVIGALAWGVHLYNESVRAKPTRSGQRNYWLNVRVQTVKNLRVSKTKRGHPMNFTKLKLHVFVLPLMLLAGCASQTPSLVVALPDKPERVIPEHLKQPPPAGSFLQNLSLFFVQKLVAPMR